MQSVMSKGHHFLKKGQDGYWYRVIDPSRKASQVFRDVMPSIRIANQARRSEVSEPASLTSVAVGWQIDPISISSEEYKNANSIDHWITEF